MFILKGTSSAELMALAGAGPSGKSKISANPKDPQNQGKGKPGRKPSKLPLFLFLNHKMYQIEFFFMNKKSLFKIMQCLIQ